MTYILRSYKQAHFFKRIKFKQGKSYQPSSVILPTGMRLEVQIYTIDC